MTELTTAASEAMKSTKNTISDVAIPSNQFNWSAKNKKLLANYTANPFQHALALKPDENANSSLPILATDITDKPLTSTQEKWLVMANNWMTETDDNFTDYQAYANEWNSLYEHCAQDEDVYKNESGLFKYLSTDLFEDILAQRLFPRLSTSKKISFIALREDSKKLASEQLVALYRKTLRYIQALIHQLKIDNPCAYQDLYQRHNQLQPEVKALLFCADIAYPHQSFSSSKCSHGYYPRALYLHHTDSTQASIFSQAYYDAISSSDYKMADTLLPLLKFIASCDQAGMPQLIVDLLGEMPLLQKRNRQLFKVLEDFDHELYLEWLIENSIYPAVAKPLSLWMKRHPILTISKLSGVLNDNHHLLSGYPDFSSMTKLFIQQNHYFDKPKFDKLSRDKAYLIQLFTHMCADLRAAHPEQFTALKTVVAAQNLTYYSSVIAPIFSEVSRVEIGDSNTAIEDQLTDENLAQISKWLITPPWLHKAYRLQAPKYANHITLALLPKPVFKSDGSKLPQALLDNLIGILHKSDLKSWINPLTDDDILQILAPFTRDSLNVLGLALWGMGIREPLAWLMNEDAIPFIHKYIFDNKGARNDTDGCRLLIRMLTASIKLWYDPNTNLAAERIAFDAHISAVLEEMVYQLYKGKPRFRVLVGQMFDEISALTGFSMRELVDLAVPTFGFNEHGERIFHLDAAGDNVLIVRLDAHLSPLLYDREGNILSRFPSAKKGDDKARFKQVSTDIKALKRQLTALYKTLNAEFTIDLHQGVHRSMRFMLTGFLKHPILRCYGQTLFWSLNNHAGHHSRWRNWHIADTFIVTDDNALMTIHYKEYSDKQLKQWQKAGKTVVLTHPAYLSESDHLAANHMLSDYAIAQPIGQMGLSCLRPNADEISSNKITRFNGQSFAINALKQNLNKMEHNFSSITEVSDTVINKAGLVYGLSNETSQRLTDPERFKIEFCHAVPEYSYCAETNERTYFGYLDTPVQIQPIDITDKNPIKLSRLLHAITVSAQ